MSRKRDTNITISAEDEVQIQQILEQYHQIASELHESTSRQQADKALASIYNMSEDAQLALLKTLSKEQNSDSADVLLAINELAPNKAVRKEAHRSLIRLTSARIYPSWTPVEEQALVTAPHPPRFWKGEATQMREGGEVQLILCWEQGLDYGEARMFGFLLDFWKDGVKDCFVEENSKRRIEALISRMHEGNEHEIPEEKVSFIDCTLAEGRRLLLEALSVNKWHGTQPHEEYRRHLPVIQQFILNAADEDIDRGNDFISPDLEPDEVVAHFIGGWSLGDYGLCYDLLSNESDLRENLERDEWIDQRRKWYDEAHPARMQYGFIREREHNQQSLWLPSSFISSRATTQRDVAAGWSVELVDTPLSGTLPETPMGTAVNKETGRHWFWTSYTLVSVGVGLDESMDAFPSVQKWRIQSMKDEGAHAQGLSIAELQDRLKEYDDRIQEITKKHAPNEPGTDKLYEEILWRMIETMHYDDALLVKLPLDRTIYEDAFSRAMSMNDAERALIYLGRAVERFTTSRAGLLLQLGATQAALANLYFQRGMEERSDRFMKLAEASLREALAIEDSVLGHILLAEVLVGKDEDEAAEAELQQAKVLNPTASEEVQIESDLGDIAMERKHYEEALRHFLRVAQLEPNHPGIWFRIGYAYRLLENYVDAESSFQRALEMEPHDILAYSELASVYRNTNRLLKAQETLEQGLSVNPDSAQLRALLASILIEKGNRRRAEELLKEAERINPDLELVRLVRQSLVGASLAPAHKTKRR